LAEATVLLNASFTLKYSLANAALDTLNVRGLQGRKVLRHGGGHHNSADAAAPTATATAACCFIFLGAQGVLFYFLGVFLFSTMDFLGGSVVELGCRAEKGEGGSERGTS
jgi:hypothetical protein